MVSAPLTSLRHEHFPNLACASVPLLNPKLHPHLKIVSISTTTVEIGCDRNYQNALAPCQTSKFFCKNGKWIGVYPQCVEVHMCSPPPAIQYAEIIDRDYDKSYDSNGLSYFPISSQVTYECLKGYVMDGGRTITCQDNGCWEAMDMWPTCIRTKETYFVELDDLNAILISSATGAGVIGILLMACLLVAYKKRKALSRSVAMPPSVIPSTGTHPAEVVNDHAVLLQHPDRLALIAFADGVQNNQNTLPSYDEATRDRSTLIQVSRLQLHRPHWPSLAICRGSNRSRSSSNADAGHHVVRHGSFVSHTPSMRSGGESMGSTDTVTISEGSTNITLDTASSHSAVSQNPSCRGHCGSLASFDGCSIVNTEGVPLLEESELEDISGGTNEAENPIVSDNTSSKISTNSAPIMTN
ncbi:hypothetical protein GWI33_002697 [Rhynchophorus ferrugineus]|uniref:Sushi domain-containing protein n=1 Tax=Rhynchophorus ferrugineus TaxID=354439 RepID=A0A834IRI0_RHYFE|nr:hypothetical protein GWI33_002697 [Rhynchophorus ferrugineus]